MSSLEDKEVYKNCILLFIVINTDFEDGLSWNPQFLEFLAFKPMIGGLFYYELQCRVSIVTVDIYQGHTVAGFLYSPEGEGCVWNDNCCCIIVEFYAHFVSADGSPTHPEGNYFIS